MPIRSLRPLAFAALTAVVSIGLLVIAVGAGWLGPDVGSGCELLRGRARRVGEAAGELVLQPRLRRRRPPGRLARRSRRPARRRASEARTACDGVRVRRGLPRPGERGDARDPVRARRRPRSAQHVSRRGVRCRVRADALATTGTGVLRPGVPAVRGRLRARRPVRRSGAGRRLRRQRRLRGTAAHRGRRGDPAVAARRQPAPISGGAPARSARSWSRSRSGTSPSRCGATRTPCSRGTRPGTCSTPPRPTCSSGCGPASGQ